MSRSQHRLVASSTGESIPGGTNQGYPYPNSDYELQPDYGSDYDTDEEKDNAQTLPRVPQGTFSVDGYGTLQVSL